MDIKNYYMKKIQLLSKVVYDNKIYIVNYVLGFYFYVLWVQGGKLKSKNELWVSDLFKYIFELFLNMIVVYEFVYLKEKDYNKVFYKLCNYMLFDYYQFEFEVCVYLIELEYIGYVFMQFF